MINHSISAESLLNIHRIVREALPDFWLGVNLLGTHPLDLFRAQLPEGIDGVWTDDASIDEGKEEQPEAESIREAIRESAWPGLYFGGVAFKYQRPVDDLSRAALLASDYMDVVTTSGPGTGHAASVDKLRAMKEALVGSPLAVASGVTPENVADFMPFVDVFLVATGISRSFTELDPELVSALVRRVREA